MNEQDAYSIGRMMLNYCRLSPEGKRRARLIFKQLLAIAENGDTAKDAVTPAEMRNDDRLRQRPKLSNLWQLRCSGNRQTGRR
jgi:hypothetical protein